MFFYLKRFLTFSLFLLCRQQDHWILLDSKFQMYTSKLFFIKSLPFSPSFRLHLHHLHHLFTSNFTNFTIFTIFSPLSSPYTIFTSIHLIITILLPFHYLVHFYYLINVRDSQFIVVLIIYDYDYSSNDLLYLKLVFIDRNFLSFFL